jgi:predicted flap endonuclease-1-like 5' DNA nuclease
MNVVAMFVLGLLIGWLAEWVIDWYYWRDRIHHVTDENMQLKERITSLEVPRSKRVPLTKNRILTNSEGQDNLQAIKGIGPTFAKRLNEAGITTFEQLSRLSAEQLQEILGTLYKRFSSKQESITAQAEEFAKLKAQSS